MNRQQVNLFAGGSTATKHSRAGLRRATLAATSRMQARRYRQRSCPGQQAGILKFYDGKHSGTSPLLTKPKAKSTLQLCWGFLSFACSELDASFFFGVMPVASTSLVYNPPYLVGVIGCFHRWGLFLSLLHYGPDLSMFWLAATAEVTWNPANYNQTHLVLREGCPLSSSA